MPDAPAFHFHVRPLCPADATGWRDLRILGVREFPLGFLTTLEEVTRQDAAHCARLLEAGTIHGLFSGPELIGFYGLRQDALEQTRHRGEVGPFFVHSAWQGKGAARAMMEDVIQQARNLGVERLELFVDTENHRAIRFYESFGFHSLPHIPTGSELTTWRAMTMFMG